MNQRDINRSGANGHGFWWNNQFKNLFLCGESLRGKTNKLEIQEFVSISKIIYFSSTSSLKTKPYPFSLYGILCQWPKTKTYSQSVSSRSNFTSCHLSILYPIFDKHFIHDSYSCRISKGTHCAVARLERFRLASSNNTHLYVLKCDIRKFLIQLGTIFY